MATTSPGLLHSLTTLRWIAVAGQALAVLLAVHVFGLRLPALPLWGGVAALALFNTWAWRSRRSAAEDQRAALRHMLVDVASLTWMIGWSGGAMNPFASLFLLPIALAAVALPWRGVAVVLLASGAGYAVSTVAGQPLPHLHGAYGDAMDLHLWGMAVNFAISAAVVAWFLTRLAHALRERERELARLREQFARSEGIVALATHAAAVAHELNTPLGTLTLMVEDALDDAAPGSPQQAEAELMRSLIDECRDRVRQLSQPADAMGQRRPLDEALEQLVDRWLLLRPTVRLGRSGELPAGLVVAWDAGVGHLLQALLNNAADASQAAGSVQVDLAMEWKQGCLRGSVRDFGRGLEPGAQRLPQQWLRSSKPGGMGVGLVLSHATVERLGGRLALDQAEGGGLRVHFELPLSLGAAP
ncbi:ATP-binding protein [Tahibacter harae]|uniref:histidine kinase n=1 Tax=Tahibacter harae TaxID=2963937 RepID=A0ABT1QV87_9GAMM|nr:ATP-binding protein [Tahibacter harae]MCQ4166188.1 ATP-binding protein [Tahibacter harae]